jgi:predicted dehydrogenase
VIGESGSLKWDGMKQEVSIYEAGTSLWRVIFSSGNSLADSYIEEWGDFLESIESGKSPRVSGKDGLKVLEVIAASNASASNGNQTLIKRSSSKESH